MRHYIFKTILEGMTVGLTGAFIFVIVLWAQAVAPGSVVNPAFGPQDANVDPTFCHWEISEISDGAHDNKPWISNNDAINNVATGLCKCSDNPDPNAAMLDVTPLNFTTGGGFLELNTQAPQNITYWQCDHDAISACTGAPYFAYLACG